MKMELTTELYKIVDNGVNLELAPEVPVHNGIVFRNPTIEVKHKLGYWPKEVQEIPEQEEGYYILDHGYILVGEGDNKYITHDIKKLLIVDERPELLEGQVIEGDHWEVQDDKYVHVYPVWTEIDEGAPEVDEAHHLAGDEWVYDDEQKTKTHVYHVLTKVDEPPALEEGQQIVEDHWEERGDEYVHVYDVRYIVDNPPELEEGQQVLDSHWEDDGVTKTKVYDRIRFVVDNKPELQEGQQIIDKFEDDDGETVTYTYEVRFIVDPGEPELADNQEIYEDHWDDDGTTRTHVYTVLTVIDNPPDVDENQELEDLGWNIDEAAGTRTHEYKVWTIVDEGPKPPAGYLYNGGEPESVKDEEKGTITKVYPYDAYPEIRVSKLALEYTLGTLGKLAAFEVFLGSLPDIDFGNGESKPVKYFYDKANELNTSNKLCVPYIEAAAKALGMSVGNVFALLKKCEVGAGV